MNTNRRRTPLARYVPVGYMALAIALAALLLPSILRPPQDLQSETASFSPDAPPDDAPPEAILQSLRQASSSTAGSRVTEIEEEVVIEAPRPPVQKQAVRGRCFGDPPRQTESLYSALCVPAWTGTDNGGATWRGVYPDEIRIAVIVGTTSTAAEGKLAREFDADDQATEHHLKVWQTYFNERFEFYGRYLQFYVVKMSTQDEDQARAAVAKAVTDYNAFALIGPGIDLPTAAGAAEAIRQKLITFIGGNNPVDFYKDAHPYAYSFTMDSWQTRYVGSELMCKQFAGKPPNINRKMDLTFDYNAPRKWGLVLYQDEVRVGARKMYEDRMAKCGVKFEAVQEYNLTDNQQSIAGTMAKMRQAGVTSVMVAVDPLTPPILTTEAARLEYYPEWFGITGTDSNSAGRLMNDIQSEHYVSIASGEIPRADEDKDWFRAYKEIDPDGEDPTSDWFRNLQQLSGGIQHAGTKLTPETFWNGLKTNPCRTPEPIWSIGGCYKAPDPTNELHYLGDYTYQDYVALQWFDLAGKDPDSSSAGAWCYMYLGNRFRFGELPTDPLPFRDPKQCIFSPPEGVQG